MEDLIGKKIKGFKFESKKHFGLFYNLTMDKFIGEVGEIDFYYPLSNSYQVTFKDNISWRYPASKIKSHLVDEFVIGEEYEFSDGWEWRKRKLLAVLPENFPQRFIVEMKDYKNRWYSYNEIRHINQPNPNQEILDQIEVLEQELEILKSKVNK